MQQKMFLKLNGVQGSSNSPRHVGEIELTDFTWGGKHQMQAIAVGRGKAVKSDLIITKLKDKTSPILWVAYTTGQNLGEGILTVESLSDCANLRRSLVLRLESILIESVTANGNGETLTLNFEKVEMIRS